MKNSTIYIGVIIIIILVSGLVIFFNYNITNKAKPASTNSILDNIVCDTTDPKYCKNDGDCICASAQTKYPGCFIGNKDYYEKCKDKSSSCFDLCEGWGQPLVKCVNNKCTNRY